MNKNWVSFLLDQIIAVLSRRAGRLSGLLITAVVVVLAAVFGLQEGAPAIAKNGSTVFELTGKVVRIADGDTFSLRVNGRDKTIRMASIDAPETHKNQQRPGQPQAQASKKALDRMIHGKTLTLSCFERDRYDRSVCDVPMGNGKTANQLQVEKGMAWANMEGRGKFLRDKSLPQRQEQAQRARLGIWQDSHPVQPWVWRYDCWKQGQC